MLIITEGIIVFLRDIKHILFKSDLVDLQNTEVYVGGKDKVSNLTMYHLYIYTRKSGDYKLESDHFSQIDKTYSIL